MRVHRHEQKVAWRNSYKRLLSDSLRWRPLQNTLVQSTLIAGAIANTVAQQSHIKHGWRRLLRDTLRAHDYNTHCRNTLSKHILPSVGRRSCQEGHYFTDIIWYGWGIKTNNQRSRILPAGPRMEKKRSWAVNVLCMKLHGTVFDSWNILELTPLTVHSTFNVLKITHLISHRICNILAPTPLTLSGLFEQFGANSFPLTVETCSILLQYPPPLDTAKETCWCHDGETSAIKSLYTTPTMLKVAQLYKSPTHKSLRDGTYLKLSNPQPWWHAAKVTGWW